MLVARFVTLPSKENQTDEETKRPMARQATERKTRVKARARCRTSPGPRIGPPRPGPTVVRAATQERMNENDQSTWSFGGRNCLE